jgi:hypothetical protein
VVGLCEHGNEPSKCEYVLTDRGFIRFSKRAMLRGHSRGNAKIMASKCLYYQNLMSARCAGADRRQRQNSFC